MENFSNGLSKKSHQAGPPPEMTIKELMEKEKTIQEAQQARLQARLNPTLEGAMQLIQDLEDKIKDLETIIENQTVHLDDMQTIIEDHENSISVLQRETLY